MIDKIRRMFDEQFLRKVDKNRLRHLLCNGWFIEHNPGTAFIELRHRNGGRQELIEVKTYGGLFTTAEADEVAKLVSELLITHFERPGP